MTEFSLRRESGGGRCGRGGDERRFRSVATTGSGRGIDHRSLSESTAQLLMECGLCNRRLRPGFNAFVYCLPLSRYVSLWNLGSYQFSNISESPQLPQKVNPSISIVLVMQACLPNFDGYQLSNVTESPQLPQKV
ncbi:hypothetical protein OPV22_026755 [Ensete ventricosum]|uniref:FLZ-type domain-containing protein n=1 Tax=Ensete ventricosum TaxID=4639 RepID=A0AAV8Q1Z9_ENSVE|nr:hypothetical protein OPV22_026755 [Ensete ventricosum]